VLDYTGSEEEIGKPIGHDIAEGFSTLPLMLAMEEPSASKRLEPLLREGMQLTAEEARDVVNTVRASRGPQRALEQAREHAAEARRRLSALGRAEAVGALAALTDYVVSRKL
jgi:geranylgeranyl pyrophosphate synthase